MAAAKGNNYCRYSKEEVLSWEKYPRNFRLLPIGFGVEQTDTTELKKNGFDLFETSEILKPKKSLLGKKRRKTIKLKEVKWGEVYILNAIGTSLFKIGHSINFKRRFRDISASSPLPLRVVKYGMCDNPNLLEDYIQNIYEEKYFKNDWFSLSEKDVEDIEIIFNEYFE